MAPGKSFQSVTLGPLKDQTGRRTFAKLHAARRETAARGTQLDRKLLFLVRPRPSLSPLRLGILVASWFLLQLRPARAENSVTYKYVDYRESDDRMVVESQYGMVEVDLGPDMHAKLTGVIDALAGATPTGQPPTVPGGPVPLAKISDRRKAWSADFSRQFPRVAATVGFANSRESDYVSNGLSLNTVTDFNQKNTMLLLGIAGTDDEIKVFHQLEWESKETMDLIVGLTQLIDPRTSVTVNLSYGHSSGFHADPYRIIRQDTEVQPGVFLPLTYPENRPDSRDKWTLFTSVNRAFPEARGALDASYRLFHDNFGTTAHTVELAWFQKFGERLTLRPGFRFYDQTAADFYRIDLNGAGFEALPGPDPNGPFYSADYRVSAFRSYTYGLKVIWAINANWQLDAAWERYEMRGTDDRTSRHVYPRADLVSLGARFSW
jgi:hypothetical protein